MKWLMRESCSERRFGGWWKWIKNVACIAWLAGFASELAAARGAAVLFDVTSVVLLWPMIAIGCVLLLAWVCQRLWGVSFIGALVGLEPYLPLILLIPLLEIVGGEGGMRTEAAFVGGKFALTSLATGGVFPMIAPPALICVWIGVLGWITYSWWRSTPQRSGIALVRGLAPIYFLFAPISLIPSLIGWIILFDHVPVWSASSSLIEQAFIATQVDGFAWRAIYERFPLALRGEAHVSTQWFMLSVGFLAFGGLMAAYLKYGLRWSFSLVSRFVTAARVGRVAGMVGIGAILALLLETTPVWGWTHIVALLVFLSTITLSILYEAAHTDLTQAITGSLPMNRPLALGEVRANDLQDGRDLWMMASLVGAWLLGWPVFLAYLLAMLAAREALEVRSPWAESGFQAVSHIGYVLMGWMAIVERGSFGSLAPALALFTALMIFVIQRWRLSRSPSTISGRAL